MSVGSSKATGLMAMSSTGAAVRCAWSEDAPTRAFYRITSTAQYCLCWSVSSQVHFLMPHESHGRSNVPDFRFPCRRRKKKLKRKARYCEQPILSASLEIQTICENPMRCFTSLRNLG